MALHKRTQLGPLLEAISGGERKQIYLFFGERFLCQQAVQQIEAALFTHASGSVHTLDGAAEDPNKLLSRILSFTLLPGLQVYRVVDTNLFHSRQVAEQIWDKACKSLKNNKSDAAARHLANLLHLGSIKVTDGKTFSDIATDQWQKLFGFSHPGQNLDWADRLVSTIRVPLSTSDDPVNKLIAAIAQGFPQDNVLILSAEQVDKRKKLFTHIKKHGEIIDCSVIEGASKAAVTQQKEVVREMVRTTLEKLNKTIEPQALEILFERIGFHPVGAVMEVEKLALYVDQRPRITSSDLEQMVGRTREDAIFELTEALGNKNSSRTMTVLDHLLTNSIHGLAIVASLRNYLRRLLIFKSLQNQPTPVWTNRMTSNEFQNDYLPAIKETGAWPDLLKGHPYALYMGFSKASEFSAETLEQSLRLLLDAEFKLKGGAVSSRLVLEDLLISLLTADEKLEA